MKKETTLLIVDDEAGLRQAIAFDFKKKGYEVVTAVNGVEAFDIFKSRPIDVVITDIRMPGGDGISLLKQLKAHSPEIPVVTFITGFADIKIEEAYELGASAVFAKPFDRKALFSVIEKALTPTPEAWEPRAERIPADFKISLSVNAANDRYQTKTFNFGKGGFFALLPADRLPSVGTSVSFAIKVASAKESLNIEGIGIVRWVRSNNEPGRPSGCGIEFMELLADSRAHVIRVINGLRTNAFIPIG